MKLFDDITRADESKRTPTTPIFEYLNISARLEIDRLRKIIEDWYTRYPDVDDKSELRNRFRSKDDFEHHGAFYELYNHELFTKMGFDLKIHPALPGSTKHPDFLAQKDGKSGFYIESTICSPSKEEQTLNKFLEDVINKIDQLNIPNFQFYFKFETHPTTPISKKKLKREISDKLNLLISQDIYIPRRRDDFSKAPVINFSIENFRFSLSVFQREDKPDTSTNVSNIFFRMGSAYKIDADQSLRSTITTKAKKYKKLDKPFLLSVDYIDHKIIELDDFDIGNALFGSEQVVLLLDDKHTVTETHLKRKLDGVLFTTQGPIYQRLSGVLFSSNITSSNFETRTPELWFLPYPNLPLDHNSFTIPKRKPNISTGEMAVVKGRDIREILGL